VIFLIGLFVLCQFRNGQPVFYWSPSIHIKAKDESRVGDFLFFFEESVIIPIFTPADGKSGTCDPEIVTKLAKFFLKDTGDIILSMLRYSVVFCCVFEGYCQYLSQWTTLATLSLYMNNN